MTMSDNIKLRTGLAILASAAMAALYARGGPGWMLGFILLVPWLLALDGVRTLAGAIASAWLMSIAFTAAAFAWFGVALGRYTQVGEVAGVALLLLAAPLFQPQFLAFALVRRLAARWHGRALCAVAACCGWVALEGLVPKLLGDSLGYGLYPSSLMRQAADLGGAAGLTLLLLLANEGVASALARRSEGLRAMARPLALAMLVPLSLAIYGQFVLSAYERQAAAPQLRVGLVQANLGDYERRRGEVGAYAVVRESLDRHFAMSHDAVVRQGAQALLWPETIYPTTFGRPKSEAGAAFDAEILATVNAAGVPLVFGTYERDEAGEYNAAAFVRPGSGLVGFYRKTLLFPFTEYLPDWLDVPQVRRLLPWAGNWQPGNGARVFPLRLADGREVPVLPLICLDDVDSALSLQGARMGAQAILSMSNDSWFSGGELGARLHHAAAAFRSIETRLPQFRATTDGFSAAIDARGEVLAGSARGAPALVIADLPVRQPVPTLMVLWGDWVGLAAAAFLLVLAAARLPLAWRGRGLQGGTEGAAGMPFPVRVAILPAPARLTAGVMRSIARAGLLGLCAAWLLNDSLRNNTLAQIRLFTVFFLVPEAIAWCLLQAFSARLAVEGGSLVLVRGAQRIELALSSVAAIEPWWLPLPGPGVSLKLASGQRWGYGLAVDNPFAFARAVADAGGPAFGPPAKTRSQVYAQARTALMRWKLDHPANKFILLPLMLAIPAFHLHQHIAYGSAFGELYGYGAGAYLSAFALWWAAWAIGVTLGAALLRAGIEAGTLLAVLLRPAQAINARRGLERLCHGLLYLGLPAWLLLRMMA